ncbi:MAG: PH domain-containing protein [Euryarchaeota archaeon]|nr:PH domain-containing protein [Euryarchaeota archaeon]
MAGRVDYLQPGEEPLFVSDRHRLSIVDGVLGILVLWLVAVAVILGVFLYPFSRFMDAIGIPLLVLVSVIAAIGLLVLYWRYKTTRYVITEGRVYKSYGKLRFYLLQTTYDKVTDMQVHQSLFGRLWGFGTITLQTAGTGLMLDGVPDPLAMKQRIESARTRFLETLVGEQGARRPAQKTTEGGPEEAARVEAEATEAGPLFRVGPSLASFLGTLASSLFFLLIVGVFIVFGTMGGQAGFFIPAAFFGVMLAFGIVNSWIQYRYTRYEVHPWGVVVTSGWLSRRRVETTYDKVTDVSTQQTLMGRVLDYGSIKINTAGSNEAPVVFSGLGDPDRVKALIDETRRKRRRV